MLIDFKFRHFSPSEELMDYVSERFQKLTKFEKKSVHIEVTFSYQKRIRRVDVAVQGPRFDMHAHCETGDFFVSVDNVTEKLASQLSKRKAKRAHRKAA